MRLTRSRRTALLAAALGLTGTALLATSVQAADVDKEVTLPSSPGSNSVTFDGHAPFNNGQANLLFDDATGACNPTDPHGETFRDEHHIKVNVPSSVDP